MAATVEEITITYEEDGIVIVEELGKEVLSKGAWATVLFRYRQYNRTKEMYGPEQYTIRRYQKRSGEYLPKSKFNISSQAQAEKIISVLAEWLAEDSAQ